MVRGAHWLPVVAVLIAQLSTCCNFRDWAEIPCMGFLLIRKVPRCRGGVLDAKISVYHCTDVPDLTSI